MLFNGQSNNNAFQVSFDNGATWKDARYVRPHNGLDQPYLTHGIDFLTYTIDVPQGATSAMLRADDICNPCGPPIDPYGVWEAQNFHIIAK
jgi:hypothetical protein